MYNKTNDIDAPILIGNNNIPGVGLPKKIEELLPNILKAVKDYGCDYYPSIIQFLTADEISEIAAYGGFPKRYPHWRWGMEYEELQTGYIEGNHRIYEMVLNTNPSIIYCLDSNTVLDNIMVIAHALGHSDFFKNNINFSVTNTGMLDTMANNADKIDKIMSEWGRKTVSNFLDHVLRLENLVDYNAAWKKVKTYKRELYQKKKHILPEYIKVDRNRYYLDSFINTDEYKAKQREKAKEEQDLYDADIRFDKSKDILGFLMNNAPLKDWQIEIINIVRSESFYFAPQGATKIINEGWASYIDRVIMMENGLAEIIDNTIPGSGVIEYAKHKTGVLGGTYSMNPYKIGYSLFLHIRDKYNKGQFGPEYENCTNMKEKLNWDTKANLGKEKIFEVRKYYDDYLFIEEFFDQEFCDKYKFFEWEKLPDGTTVIKSRDYKKIKQKLLSQFVARDPNIWIEDDNYRNKNELLLNHEWIGEPLYEPFVVPVLNSIRHIWQKDLYLTTRDDEGNDITYYCHGYTDRDVVVINTKDLIKEHFEDNDKKKVK